MSTKKLSKTRSQKQRRQLRVFSESFKREKVGQLIAKQISVQQISDLYHVSRSSVYKWLYKYSELEPGIKTVVQMESEAQKTKMLLNRVAELERIIGQKQLRIDLDEKVFDFLNVELGYDVKKKYAQQLSNGSD